MKDPAAPPLINGSTDGYGPLSRPRLRFRRIGLQWRIALYVATGLTVMFGLLLFIGFRSVDEATMLNFQERLGAARTFSIILEHDLLHGSADVLEDGGGLLTAENGPELQDEVEDLLGHIRDSDSFAFFNAGRICLFDPDGQVLAEASSLPPGVGEAGCAAGAMDRSAADGYGFLTSTAVAAADGGFGAVGTPVAAGSEEPIWVIVDLMAYNSDQGVGPALYGGQQERPAHAFNKDNFSHMEVFGPDGTVVLGIGADEHPGAISVHLAEIENLDLVGASFVTSHLSAWGDHVMAVVPIADTGFTLIVEQPNDDAMGLPMRLRRQLFLWSGIGFAVALSTAWVTTRSVVKPTAQLTVAARRIAGGDLDSPITVAAHGEVGTLAESLESMRQQTRAATAALADAKSNLEMRVEERTERLEVLLDKLITAQEDERHRIARELHDETAQTLGALTIALDRTRDSFHDQSEETRRHLAQARGIASQLLAETRRLILDLRPMMLDDMGLTPAIRWYVGTRLQDNGIDAALNVDQPFVRLPSHIETALFRIVQEAVNNIAKHSQAQHAEIGLSFSDEAARIVVSDDGKGFDVQEQLRHQATDGGVGLAGMRERVSLLSGVMEVRSNPASGTVIEVEVPIRGGAT